MQTQRRDTPESCHVGRASRPTILRGPGPAFSASRFPLSLLRFGSMTQMTKWLYLLTLAVWIGSIVFFSFVVAPTVFKVLKPEDAAKLQRAVFPKYYLVGMICAALGIMCVGLLLADNAFGKWPGVLSLLLLAGVGATDLWLRQTVVPHMNNLRERRAAIVESGKQPEPALEDEWKSLHRLSVQLNLAVLLCGFALLFLLVFARVV